MDSDGVAGLLFQGIKGTINACLSPFTVIEMKFARPLEREYSKTTCCQELAGGRLQEMPVDTHFEFLESHTRHTPDEKAHWVENLYQ